MTKHRCLLFIGCCLALLSVRSLAQSTTGPDAPNAASGNIIPGREDISHYDLPVIGAWFWDNDDIKPGGYRYFIDMVRKHSPYNLLTTSVRIPGKDITDLDVHNQLKKAVTYAKESGIGISLELDPRLSLGKYSQMYPDELQQSLWLKEVDLSKEGPVEAAIHSIALSDHMTGRKTSYIPLRSALTRVYAYRKTAGGIDRGSLKDITAQCTTKVASADSIVISLPADESAASLKACVMVSFTRLAPDVFAPHLIEYQNDIIRDYSDLPLAGVMKDEWGFPPSYPIMRTKGFGHFWHSKYYAEAYAKKTGGRELLADCLLMYVGVRGEERDRFMAINSYMELNWQRNSELEDNFYQTTKKTFGSDALVTVHATWWPYPNQNEFRKNGLDWWTATRDLGQTDETTPFAVRTALSKKWNSPVWYNQYYATDAKDYQEALWSSALGGGRINFHPFYPNTSKNGRLNGALALFRGDIMRAESRVRLLDFISRSPLNNPVAVIFGHTSAMNWAGPYFEDVGMRLADSLWRMGIPADLIPSSEIGNNSLRIDEDGWISYGKQRYAAVILYDPEFERPSTAEFFNRAAKGKTALFRVGNWTMDFNGQAYDGNAALPQQMKPGDIPSITAGIARILKKQGIALQAPATQVLKGFATPSNAPATTGFSRLIDGTLIQVAGTHNVSGDPIRSKMKIGKYNVEFDAVGVAAVRLDAKGGVEALAAGGLKQFKAGRTVINLDERTDFALWKTATGAFKGVIQGTSGEIPPPLKALTNDWTRIAVPTPLPD